MDFHIGTFFWTIFNFLCLLLLVGGLAYLILYYPRKVKRLDQRLSNIEDKLQLSKDNHD